MQDNQNSNNSTDTTIDNASQVEELTPSDTSLNMNQPLQSSNTSNPQSENSNTPFPDNNQVPLSTDTVISDPSTTDFTRNEDIVTAPHAPKKYGGRKIIATIFGVLILIGGVAAGVYLVQRQQDLREKAASGSACEQSPDCELIDNAQNKGSKTITGEITYVEITDKEYHKYYPGDNDDGCRRVNISDNNVSWEKYGDGPNCKDISNVQIRFRGSMEFIKICHYTSDPSAHPWQAIEVSKQGWDMGHDDAHDFKKTEYDFLYTNDDPNCPWPEPGNQGITCADLWCEGESPQPTNPQTTASCSEVKAYNNSWVLLTSQELKTLKNGEVVRFTVSGTSTSGTFDKARFSVNSQSLGETTLKKPGSEEFYIEYTIPESVNSFDVDAQIFHSEFGWF